MDQVFPGQKHPTKRNFRTGDYEFTAYVAELNNAMALSGSEEKNGWSALQQELVRINSLNNTGDLDVEEGAPFSMSLLAGNATIKFATESQSAEYDALFKKAANKCSEKLREINTGIEAVLDPDVELTPEEYKAGTYYEALGKSKYFLKHSVLEAGSNDPDYLLSMAGHGALPESPHADVENDPDPAHSLTVQSKMSGLLPFHQMSLIGWQAIEKKLEYRDRAEAGGNTEYDEYSYRDYLMSYFAKTDRSVSKINHNMADPTVRNLYKTQVDQAATDTVGPRSFFNKVRGTNKIRRSMLLNGWPIKAPGNVRDAKDHQREF